MFVAAAKCFGLIKLPKMFCLVYFIFSMDNVDCRGNKKKMTDLSKLRIEGTGGSGGLGGESQPTSQGLQVMTETAKEASARAIADHNQIVKLNSALYEITKLNSRTTNYAVARKIACVALGIDDSAMKEGK